MRITAILLVGLCFFSSCIENPEFPNTPHISFNNIYFVDQNTDSLVVQVDFTDGDGNLGIDSRADITYPFHQFNYYNKKGEELNKLYRGNLNLPIGETGYLDEAIKYSDKQSGEIDTLPPYAYPYNCTNWRIVEDKDNNRDTVYYQLNPYHFNIYVQFFSKEGLNEEFTPFNFTTSNSPCGINYHGRFPVLRDLDIKKDLEGTITYTIKGAFLKEYLQNKYLKVRVYIYDRALNRSNSVESQVFFLEEISH